MGGKYINIYIYICICVSYRGSRPSHRVASLPLRVVLLPQRRDECFVEESRAGERLGVVLGDDVGRAALVGRGGHLKKNELLVFLFGVNPSAVWPLCWLYAVCAVGSGEHR